MGDQTNKLNAICRGMSEEGGFEACEQMIRQDIITGLGAYLRNVCTYIIYHVIPIIFEGAPTHFSDNLFQR